MKRTYCFRRAIDVTDLCRMHRDRTGFRWKDSVVGILQQSSFTFLQASACEWQEQKAYQTRCHCHSYSFLIMACFFCEECEQMTCRRGVRANSCWKFCRARSLDHVSSFRFQLLRKAHLIRWRYACFMDVFHTFITCKNPFRHLEISVMKLELKLVTMEFIIPGRRDACFSRYNWTC